MGVISRSDPIANSVPLKLTLPCDEVKCRPQLATLFRPAPTFKLQRAAFAPDAKLMDPMGREPGYFALETANKKVRSLIDRVEVRHHRRPITIERPELTSSVPLPEAGTLLT